LTIAPHFNATITVNFGNEWRWMLLDKVLYGGERFGEDFDHVASRQILRS
jgi:hypothetical protein